MAKKPGARTSKAKLKRKTLKNLQPKSMRQSQQARVVGGKMVSASSMLPCAGK
jgi:hypothetical protein